MDSRAEETTKSIPEANVSALRSLSQEANGKSSWTVAIDLATNMRGADGKPTGAGATDKWAKLQQMAKETGETPVKFVVSVTRPENIDFEKEQKLNAQKPTSLSGKFFPEARHPQVDTFVISGGQIDKVESHQSQGTGQDIENLLKVAADKAPSDRLGLVIFAHGTGTEFFGIQGDSGTVQLRDLRKDIKDGLGTRDALDFVAFDGCVMATTETAHMMQQVSKSLVASAEEEIAMVKGGHSGINLNAPMHQLLQHPEMTGAQLAASFISEAQKGANGTPQQIKVDEKHLRSAVDTLVALDLTRYPKFEQSLNNLATNLSSALSVSNNKEAIVAAVDSTPSLPGRTPSYMNNQRDTREFAKSILAEVAAGKIVDDGSLTRSAQTMLNAQTDMTIGNFGSSEFYRGLGGLTVELPAASSESRQASARRMTLPGTLIALAHDGRDYSYKTNAQKTAALDMDAMHRSFPAETKALSEMDSAARALLKARSPKEYDRALSNLSGSAEKFLDSPKGKEYLEQTKASLHTYPSKLTGAAWKTFVDDLTNQEPLKLQ